MLIYKLLGDSAQQSFARSWGISYGASSVQQSRHSCARSELASLGMNAALEWKDVLIESIKGAIILALLERFYVTRANSWFEDHIGACSRWARSNSAGG